MPSSTINFRMTGFGRILQEIGQAPKKLQEVTRAGQAAARAAASAGAAWAQRVSGRGGGAARNYPSAWVAGLGGGAPAGTPAAGGGGGAPGDNRAARGIAGRWGKAVGAFGGFGGGAVSQVAEMANAPTRALAAVGIAGIAAGVALRTFAKIAEAGTRQIEASIRTTASTRGSLAAATAGANQGALSSVLGRREELVGGDRGNSATRGFFAKTDALQKQIDQAQLERALKYGEGEMRDQLSRTRAPEAAALTELSKKADEEVEIQRQILDRMNWFQKAVRFVGNGLDGRSFNADVIDAQRQQGAIAAGAP